MSGEAALDQDIVLCARPQTLHCGCRMYSSGRFFRTRRVSQWRQRQWNRAISVTARHGAVE